MKVTIIGWYGTETIGDRAIFTGILSILNEVYDEFEIFLGSLFPFFSQRMIKEDSELYNTILQKNINILLFDSTKPNEITRVVNQSDLIIMGGGPLMDLEQLHMINFTFCYGKKRGLKTALLGVGIGPLKMKSYQKIVYNILCNSDLIILRDNQSSENLKYILRTIQKGNNFKNIFIGTDPAVKCVKEFKKLFTQNQNSEILINLREFPLEYNIESDQAIIEIKIADMVERISEHFCDQKILLIPMHYFYIGGDDRDYLNRLRFKLNRKNITVQNSILSLQETMMQFQNAYLTIGMRFHSIVLQTILNGQNFILDYTEYEKGKIYGFIHDIDKEHFYSNRYHFLQSNHNSIEFDFDDRATFKYDSKLVAEKLSIFSNNLKTI